MQQQSNDYGNDSVRFTYETSAYANITFRYWPNVKYALYDTKIKYVRI